LHTPNPRLKPGAFKFDAFSILFGYSKQGLNRLFVSFDTARLTDAPKRCTSGAHEKTVL